MKNLTLSNKILVGVLPVVLSCVIGFGLFNYFAVRGQILRGIEYQLSSMAEQTSLTLEAFFEQRNRDLESLTEVPLLSDYRQNVAYDLLQEAETYRYEIEQYFLKFSNRTPLYDLIMYVDPNGHPVAVVKEGQVIKVRERYYSWIQNILKYKKEDHAP